MADTFVKAGNEGRYGALIGFLADMKKAGMKKVYLSRDELHRLGWVNGQIDNNPYLPYADMLLYCLEDENDA